LGAGFLVLVLRAKGLSRILTTMPEWWWIGVNFRSRPDARLRPPLSWQGHQSVTVAHLSLERKTPAR
jgi:hypothetical protein